MLCGQKNTQQDYGVLECTHKQMRWSHFADYETNLDFLFCLRQNMSMLTAERAPFNPQATARVTARAKTLATAPIRVQHAVRVIPRALPRQSSASLWATLAKLGDRQSWLLLALILIPVFGAIHNFMTYGFTR
jgi:hypothetical protein